MGNLMCEAEAYVRQTRPDLFDKAGDEVPLCSFLKGLRGGGGGASSPLLYFKPPIMAAVTRSSFSLLPREEPNSKP